MALFKISRGSAANLNTAASTSYATNGFAYFTTDEGKLYIDIDGDGTTTPAVIGENRIPLNAQKADIAALANFANVSARIAFGTCTTAANQAEKEIDIDLDELGTLQSGSMIAVYFLNENTANNPMLSINTNLYPAHYSFTSALGNTPATSWESGSVKVFTYMQGVEGDTTNRFVLTNPYSDYKVTQAESTSSDWRKILLHHSHAAANSNVIEETDIVYAAKDVEVQPSTGTISAKKFKGSLEGNADTATTLQNARTIQTDLASTSAASFDGSANIEPGIKGVLPIANGGTSSTSAYSASKNLGYAFWGGYGLNLNTAVDLNEYDARNNFGTYYVKNAAMAANIASAPRSNAGFKFLSLNSYDSNRTIQVAWYGGNDPTPYIRVENGTENNFTDWSKVAYVQNAVGSAVNPVYVSATGAIKASAANVGSNTQFTYMANGNITATTAVIGGTTKLWYLNSGVATNSTANVGTNINPVYLANGVVTATTASVGGTEQPIYSNAGVLTNTTYYLKANIADGTQHYLSMYTADRTIGPAKNRSSTVLLSSTTTDTLNLTTSGNTNYLVYTSSKGTWKAGMGSNTDEYWIYSNTLNYQSLVLNKQYLILYSNGFQQNTEVTATKYGGIQLRDTNNAYLGMLRGYKNTSNTMGMQLITYDINNGSSSFNIYRTSTPDTYISWTGGKIGNSIYPWSNATYNIGSDSLAWNQLSLAYDSSSARNKGVRFMNSGTLVANIGASASGLGIYSNGNLYLRPSLTETEGIQITTTTAYPAVTNKISLGTASYGWQKVYSKQFIKNETTNAPYYIISPAGGSYSSGTSSVTGALQITLPVLWTAHMISFKVDIYNYNTKEVCTYNIAGYNYTASGGYWANCNAYSTGQGDHSNLTVRFGYTETNVCILIGETNTIWNYPQVEVRDVHVGYQSNNLEKWTDSWSISFVTTLPTITSAVTKTTPNLIQGTVDTIPYYDTATSIASTEKIKYFTYPYTDTTNGPTGSGSSSGLIITETSVGGAANLKSGNAALVSYGDSGPQIRFKSSDTGALLYHHYDAVSDGGDGSFHFLNSSGVATVAAGGFTSFANAQNDTGFRLRHKTTNTSYGFMRIATLGTASTKGNGELTLGNSTASGNDNNANGSIYLYGDSSNYISIYPTSITSNITMGATVDRFTMPKLNITSTADVGGKTSSSPPLSIGTLTSTHIEIDTNEILAKNSDTTTGILYLQDEDGLTAVGGSQGLYVRTSGQNWLPAHNNTFTSGGIRMYDTDSSGGAINWIKGANTNSSIARWWGMGTVGHAWYLVSSASSRGSTAGHDRGILWYGNTGQTYIEYGYLDINHSDITYTADEKGRGIPLITARYKNAGSGTYAKNIIKAIKTAETGTAVDAPSFMFQSGGGNLFISAGEHNSTEGSDNNLVSQLISSSSNDWPKTQSEALFLSSDQWIHLFTNVGNDGTQGTTSNYSVFDRYGLITGESDDTEDRRIRIVTGTSHWTYLTLNDGSKQWDIASRSDNNTSSLQFRNNNSGSATTVVRFDLTGHVYANANIYAGAWTANTAGTAERAVYAQSGAGKINMFSGAAVTANRGIYLTNAAGTGGYLLSVNQKNYINAHAVMAVGVGFNFASTVDTNPINVSSQAGTSAIGSTNYTNTTVDQSSWGQLYFRIPALHRVYATNGDTSSTVTSSSYYQPQWWFRAWSLNTSSGARLSRYESYNLPSCDNDRTSNASYNIITTKNPATNITSTAATGTTKYYMLGQSAAGNQQVYIATANSSGTANKTGIYFTGATGVLMGAAWNDYAEFRESKDDLDIEPGRVVKEVGDDSLELTNSRLQRGCRIISDTYGFGIGENDKCKLPIATAGRVLAYPYESLSDFKESIGWPVCSGPNGTVSIMTEEEERDYPSRILGTISSVPNYKVWHGGADVEVNGRVWIQVR